MPNGFHQFFKLFSCYYSITYLMPIVKHAISVNKKTKTNQSACKTRHPQRIAAKRNRRRRNRRRNKRRRNKRHESTTPTTPRPSGASLLLQRAPLQRASGFTSLQRLLRVRRSEPVCSCNTISYSLFRYTLNTVNSKVREFVVCNMLIMLNMLKPVKLLNMLNQVKLLNMLNLVKQFKHIEHVDPILPRIRIGII